MDRSRDCKMEWDFKFPILKEKSSVICGWTQGHWLCRRGGRKRWGFYHCFQTHNSNSDNRFFRIVVLEKTLESPLDSKEIKPVNPKGNQPLIFIEGWVVKLKLQYFGHLMQRADSLKKTLMLGKIEGRKRRGQQRIRCLDGITNSMDMGWVISGSWWWTRRHGVLQFMGSPRVRHDWVTELNWTER